MKRSRDKAGFRRFFRYLEESGLKYPLRKRVLRHGSSLFDVYMDVRTEAATAARIEVWWYLVAELQRSPAEVAALFDRDRSSVVYALRKLGDRANALDVRVAADTVDPLAKLVARPRRRVTP